MIKNDDDGDGGLEDDNVEDLCAGQRVKISWLRWRKFKFRQFDILKNRELTKIILGGQADNDE